MDHANRLATANSPYLRQHSDNPVDWYPWGPEALDKARHENKPLIISVGYAACHWCHVMAHESFMDRDVAEYMNQHFVNIKVDREERPDIDQVYMEAVQHITGGGGWPLNAFALPDGRPFYGGTYFQKQQWLEMLKRIVSVYHNQLTELEEQAESLTTAIRAHPAGISTEDTGEKPGREMYTGLLEGWERLMDTVDGGFNSAPKFPMPVVWNFLLQYQFYTGHKEALKYARITLDKMAQGGIYDQAGGGFARYSTDRLWKIPHFEKMLYDNAQLVSLYSKAWKVIPDDEYADVVSETLSFLEREMRSPEGAFYSSLDADSEGEEGRFYTFTLTEIKNALDPDLHEVIPVFYECSDEGNWHSGKNILFRLSAKAAFARQHNLGPDEFTAMLIRARQQLLKYREKRMRPSRDEKIITAWNSMMISAYLDAFKAFGKDSWLRSALQLARFIEKKMMGPDDRLYRSCLNGKANINGFLDDHALLAQAFTDLYETTFDKHWLDLAFRLCEKVLSQFSDPEHALFFYTPRDAENLIARKHEIADAVIPSSNSVMVHVMIRLGHLLERDDLISHARKLLYEVSLQVQSNTPYFANYAMAVGFLAFPIHEVAIMGEEAASRNIEMQRNFLPDCIFLGGKNENLPLLEGKLINNSTLIYVCTDKICKLPVKDIQTALPYLS